jgi:hypothetical protein
MKPEKDPLMGSYVGSRFLMLRRIFWAVPIVSLFTLASYCLQPVSHGAVGSATPEIALELSVREDGTATPLWTKGVAISIGESAANDFAGDNLPLSPKADAWLQVLGDALPFVAIRASELAFLFDVPSLDATVVVGNRGSSDGFAWVPSYIGINVQAFADTYGLPTNGASERVVRIVAHEYLHLLTYAFYENHIELRQTPFDRALWTLFFEGIGDYVSVSSRWLPDEQGVYSITAAGTLTKLEPIFIERLEMLATANNELESELRAGISMGKFDEKWGSLPVAIWLHSEVKRCGEAATLQAFFRLERAGVLMLASRHAAPELRPRIKALQDMLGGHSNRSDNPNAECLASAQSS